jgi:hypothetical protein
MVTVRASDGTLHADRMVRVTVTGVNEAPEITRGGLSISGRSSVSHPEDSTTTTVGEYTARGENPAGARWTLEGDDRLDFRLSTSRGESVMLRFSSSPDYERPADADKNNVYMVTLKATEGTNTDTHDVTVRVTDVNEDGMVAAISGTARVGETLTAGAVTDPDGSVSGETYEWQQSMTMNDADFSAIGGATSSTYTVMAGDVDYYLRVMVTYTDGHGSGKTATSAMTAKVVAADAVDPLVARYAGDDGVLQRGEVINAINDYLDAGVGAPSRTDVTNIINLYLDS